jgi:hypothetical protein
MLSSISQLSPAVIAYLIGVPAIMVGSILLVGGIVALIEKGAPPECGRGQNGQH